MKVERERLCGILRDPPSRDGPITPGTMALAREEGVHLLLAERLHLPELDDERRRAAVIGAARESELRTVLEALAQASVRPILIKGASLAYTHYARPELRPRADTDVMIVADERKTVARVLASIGYERPAEADGELTTGQFHFVRDDRCGILHALDVHWRISNVRVFAEALTYEELARDAVPIPALGPHARGAAPQHALFLACIHRVAHHADADDLLWLYDIRLLAQGTEADAAAFAALASARGMRAVCRRGLALASAAFGGIDPRWLAALSNVNGAGNSDEREAQAAAFLRGPMSLAGILKADLAATPGWRRRLRILREHLFPKRAFMHERYGTRSALALPFLYLYRIVRGAPRWVRR
jgi:hypothetical protein